MTLIKNWRDAWKFTSVQSALIMLVGNIAVTVLRLVAQPSLNGGNDA